MSESPNTLLPWTVYFMSVETLSCPLISPWHLAQVPIKYLSNEWMNEHIYWVPSIFLTGFCEFFILKMLTFCHSLGIFSPGYLAFNFGDFLVEGGTQNIDKFYIVMQTDFLLLRVLQTLLSSESLALPGCLMCPFYFLCTLLSISSSQSRAPIMPLSCLKMFNCLLGAFSINFKLFNLASKAFHDSSQGGPSDLLFTVPQLRLSRMKGSLPLYPALSHLPAFVRDAPSA